MIEFDNLEVGMEVEAKAPNGVWVPANVLSLKGDQTIIAVRLFYPDGRRVNLARHIALLRPKPEGGAG